MSKRGVIVLLIAVGFSLVSFFILNEHTSSLTIDLDAHRDYLMAYNLVTYKDIPLVGPPMQFFGLTSNSPIYYYFLAGILLLRKSFSFVQSINILFQAVNILIVYVLEKKIFSANAGLVAAGFLAISSLGFTLTATFWQPYWMLPFLDLSILLLIFAYEKKSLRYVIGSVMAFWMAAVLHGAAYAVAPLYIFFLARWLFTVRRRTVFDDSFLLIVLAFGLWMLAYLPVLVAFRLYGVSAGALVRGWVISPIQYVQSLWVGARLLFTSVFQAAWIGLVGIIFAVCGVFQQSFSREDRRRLGVIFLFMFQSLALFAIADAGRLLDYYYLPATTGMFLLMGYAIGNGYAAVRPIWRHGIRILCGVFFLLAMVPSFTTLSSSAASSATAAADHRDILGVITSHIEKGEDFNIQGFTTDPISGIKIQAPVLSVNYDVFYWPALEAKLSGELVHADQANSTRDYAGNDNASQWFVVCFGKELNRRNECISLFEKLHPSIHIVTTYRTAADYTLSGLSRGVDSSTKPL